MELMMKKVLLTLTALASLTIANAYATPLRELIFEAIDQEQHGVLTQTEIRNARRFGAAWYRQPVEGNDLDRLEKVSAKRAFSTNASKQHEWILECGIGWMMAAEAALWDPNQN
jgi:hypothetical protein